MNKFKENRANSEVTQSTKAGMIIAKQRGNADKAIASLATEIVVKWKKVVEEEKAKRQKMIRLWVIVIWGGRVCFCGGLFVLSMHAQVQSLITFYTPLRLNTPDFSFDILPSKYKRVRERVVKLPYL